MCVSQPQNNFTLTTDCEAPGDEGSSSVKHEHQEDGGDEQTTVSTGMAGGAGKKKRTHPRASAGGLATGAASSSSSLSSSSSPSSGGGKGKRAKIAAAPTGAPSSHHSVGSSTAAFALLGIGGGAAGGGAAAAASGASGVAASSSAAASSAAASGPAAPPVTVPELLANIDSDLRSAGVADEERVKTSFARFGEAAEAYVQATGPEVKLRFIAANVAFNQLHESVAAEVGKLKAEREEGLAARAAAIQAHADGIPKLLVEQGLGDLVEAVVAAESAAPLEQRLAERTQLEADKAQAATAMAYCAAAPPGLSADHYASIQAEIKRLQQRVQAVEAELLVFPDPLALQETINEVKARFASLAEQREQLRKDEEAQQPDPSGRHVELFFSFMRGAF